MNWTYVMWAKGWEIWRMIGPGQRWNTGAGMGHNEDAVNVRSNAEKRNRYIYIFKWSLSFGDKNIFHFTFKKNSAELPLEAGDSYWLFDTKPRFKSCRKALRQRTLKWTVKDTLKHVKKLYVDLLIEPTQTSGGFNSTKNVALFKFWSYFVL